MTLDLQLEGLSATLINPPPSAERRRLLHWTHTMLGSLLTGRYRSSWNSKVRRPLRKRRFRPELDHLEERRLLTTTVAVPMQDQVAPIGGLIYDSGRLSTTLAAPGDVQEFTLSIDPAQQITVLVEATGGLQPSVTVTDPSATPLGSSSSPGPDESAVLQTVPASVAGTYTVSISGVGGTSGDANVRILLNSALEDENHGGATNDSLATAQNLDNAFIAPSDHDPTVSRAAVIGRLRTGLQTGDVYFAEQYGGTIVHIDSDGNEVARITHPALQGGSILDVEQGRNNDFYAAILYGTGGALLRFDFGGNLLDSLPLPDGDYYETGFDVAEDGSLWVTRPATDQLLHLDSAGTLLSTLALEPGFYPNDVAARADGQLFVTGYYSGLWQVDSSTGDASLLSYVTNPYGVNFTPEGNLTVSQFYGGVLQFDTAGNLQKQIGDYYSYSYDAQVDPAGNTWTNSFYNWATLKYDTNGNYLTSAFGYYPRGLFVVGVDGPEPVGQAPDAGDFYSVSLEAGQSVTLSLQTLNGPTPMVELQDSNGNSLALGTWKFAPIGQKINNFTASETGTYFIRVTGQQGAEYSLVVLRNADFEFGQFDPYVFAPQQLEGVNRVFGYISGEASPGYGSSPWQFNIGGGGVFDPPGGMYHPTDNQFTGALDEVAIWDQALSADQILAVVDAARTEGGDFSQAVLDTSPLGYWRFNETGGDTAVNQGTAGTSLDGTYVGGQRSVSGPDQTQGQPLPGLEPANAGISVGPDESYVHINASPLNQLSAFTMAGWVKRDPLSDYRIGLFGQNDVIEFGFIEPNVLQAWTPYGGYVNYYFADESLPVGEWFYLTAVGDGNSLTLYVNGQAVQSGGWSIPSPTEDDARYYVEVKQGDNLVIQTETPAGDPQRPLDFHNRLNPAIELYDPFGNLVGADDNSSADGKNARLEHTAQETGTYQVRIFGPAGSNGEYLLLVDGATGELPEFRVQSTSPADGASGRGPISSFTVEFNDSILLTSLQAGDLTLNGVPAVGVTVVNASTVEFELPAHSDGLQEVMIAGGAVQDLQGTPIAAFTSHFYDDLTPPRVVASSVQSGDVFPTGALSVELEFSEAMSTWATDAYDAPLRGNVRGIDYFAESWSWNDTSTRITLNFANLPEDNYTLTLISGDYSFEDLAGFDLDGEHLASPIPPNQSGDGVEGGNFAVDFVIDVDIAPFPAPLSSVAPAASLIRQGSLTGVIQPGSDVDRYTLTVDPGQQITVVVDPLKPLKPRVELFWTNGTTQIKLKDVIATTPGSDAVIQTYKTPGKLDGSGPGPLTYEIKVSSADGSTGGYDLRVLLNAAVESENHDGPRNDSLATAQNLAPSMLPLHSAAANPTGPSRAAIVGKLSEGASAGDVFFVELDSGNLVHLTSDGVEIGRTYLGGGILWDVEQGIDNDLYVARVLYSGAGELLHLDYQGKLLNTISLPDGNYQDIGLDVAPDGSLWTNQASANLLLHLDAAGNLLATYAFDPGYANDVAVGPLGQVVATSAISGGVWLLDEATGQFSLFANADTPAELNFTPSGELTVAGLPNGTYRFDSAGNLLSIVPTGYSIDSQVDLDNHIWSSAFFYGQVAKYDDAGQVLAAAYGYYPTGLAVIGSDGPAPPESLRSDSGDYYSLSLKKGQSTTVVLSSLNQLGVNLELLDSAGHLLAQGINTSGGQKIPGFVAPSTGTYFVRVTGTLKAEYSLVATLDAELENESNSSIASAQAVQVNSVAGSKWVMGQIAGGAVNHSGGFADATGLMTNGSAQLVDNVARLTHGNSFESGSVFSNEQVDVSGFHNVFQFQMLPGTEPIADGITFTMQANSPYELGPGGGGLGYGYDQPYACCGIPNSVAVKFDVYDNAGEGTNSTGLFSGGHSPTYPQPGSGDVVVDLTGTGIDLSSYHPFQVEMSYDGTTLVTVITDTVTMASATQTYLVDIPGLIGSNSAYIGFTAGTGGLTAVQEILSWQYSPNASDFYRVEMANGGRLELETITPAGDSGELLNELDPMLRLYDAAGNLVASNDNSAVDGRNAKLSYRVPQGRGGTYFVEVLPSDATESTSGDYLLTIKGARDSQPPFLVSQTDPAAGSQRRGPTTQFTVDFNDAILLATVQAADLKVDGVPAISYSLVDGNTVTFELPTLTSGEHHVTIAAGAVQDVQGTPLQAFETHFIEDLEPPRIVSSSIQPGDLLPAGELTYVVQFSEPMRTDSLSPYNVFLEATDPYAFYYPDHVQFDTTGTTLTVHFSNLPEAHYRLTMPYYNFQDRAEPWGFFLDGEPPVISGDGVEGGDFSVEFDLDIDTLPVPGQLIAKPPLGSLIYDPAFGGLIQSPSDVDNFTVDLDAGQTITLIVTPSGDLQPTVALYDPSNSLLGQATSSQSEKNLVLQTIPVSVDGTYTISIGSTAETIGQYQVQVILNAAVEDESHQGPRNDSLATAQDLSGAFVALPVADSVLTQPDRAAVLGRLQLGTSNGDVFVAAAYDYAIVHLDASNNELGRFNYWNGLLLDVEQGVHDDIYASVSTWWGNDHVVRFDYTGRVLQEIGLPDGYGYGYFGLDVAKDGSLWVTQGGANRLHHLDSDGNVLASYDFSPGIPFDVVARDDGQVFVTSSEQTGIWQLDPATGAISLFALSDTTLTGLNLTPDGGFTAGSQGGGTQRFDSAGQLVQSIPSFAYFLGDAQVGLLGGLWTTLPNDGSIVNYDDLGNQVSSHFINSPRGLAVIGVDGPEPSPEFAPDPGDHYSITLAAGQRLSLVLKSFTGGEVAVELLDPLGNPLATSVAVGTNVDQVIHEFVAPESQTYFVRVHGTAGTEYSLTALRDAIFDVEDNGQLDTAQAIDGTQVALGYVDPYEAGDLYRITVGPGEVLTATTATPGGGPGEFVNQLNPLLELLDENGSLVTWDDNSAPDGRNAQIGPIALPEGTYYLKVTATEWTSGEYVLSVAKSAQVQPAVQVVGDANGDGFFDSADIVQVFLAGKYEDDTPGNATFEEGDWNGDGDFDSADMLFAFMNGEYERREGIVDNPYGSIPDDLLHKLAKDRLRT